MLEYLLSPNIGVELLAAWPFEHTVKLNGADDAKVKQLPPTVSLQYHFIPAASISPFVGVGLNFTRFFNVDERDPLTGTEQWLAGVDVRWIDIDTTARVNGAKVGTVNVDPLVYGAYVGYRF
jgi:outer membrane protein